MLKQTMDDRMERAWPDNEPFSISEWRSSEDQDLLNTALVDTCKAGGRVFAIPAAAMPGGYKTAADVRS